VTLLALSIVQPHTPPRLHQRSLSRRVRGLQTMPEGCILRVGEPVSSVSLQGSELPNQRRELARSLPGYLLRLLPIYESDILRYQELAPIGA
jgi:hypothetical protein